MTTEEREARHKERYGRIMRREITLAEALAENDADWQAWRDDGVQINVVDVMRGGRVIAEGVPVHEVARKGPR